MIIFFSLDTNIEHYIHTTFFMISGRDWLKSENINYIQNITLETFYM